MLDLLIRGDRVATVNGAGAWDIGIQGEKIAAIASAGSLRDSDAHRVVDARGKVVIPGGIDPHIHCKFGQPGGHMSFAPDVVSRAALFGGTTTMLDFAIWSRGQTIQEAIEKRLADCWTDACHCDYALHILLTGKVPHDVVAQIPEAIQAGYPSVKIFTTEVRPERSNWRVDYGDIWEVLQVLGKHDGVACIHAEDNDLVMHMYEKMIREGRVSFELMSEVHSSLTEELAFRRVIRLAENVERAALYMMHVSSRRALEVITESRAKGYPIYGEALHQYALFTSDHYKRPNGQIYHTYPSLKTKDDHKAMWDSMLNGSISSIATDGLCTPLSIKISGNRIDNTVGGSAGIEPRVSIMYTETVVRRGWSLDRFVDLIAANAARIFGLYPRKGVIAPGSDADVVILDPALGGALRKENLHETDYSAWEGYEAAVWPAMTVLRGKVVVDGGQFHGAPRDGQWLPRKIAESTLSGPARVR